MTQNIRPSAIAGSWYPGNPAELRRMIDGFLSDCPGVELDGELVGLITPHAGYVYSGRVAAHAYKLLTEKSFDVVVLLSPMHRFAVGRYVVNHSDYYETPLGLVPVHQELTARLAKQIPLTTIRSDQEHSLEIQLPFLQAVLHNFTILPIMIGHGDVYQVQNIVSALESVLPSSDYLLIASSDLHHDNRYQDVLRNDASVIDALKTFDLNKIRKRLSRNDCSVCGRVPISALLEIAKMRDADQLSVLHATNSAEITGERESAEYCVGYLAAAVTRPLQ